MIVIDGFTFGRRIDGSIEIRSTTPRDRLTQRRVILTAAQWADIVARLAMEPS